MNALSGLNILDVSGVLNLLRTLNEMDVLNVVRALCIECNGWMELIDLSECIGYLERIECNERMC